MLVLKNTRIVLNFIVEAFFVFIPLLCYILLFQVHTGLFLVPRHAVINNANWNMNFNMWSLSENVKKPTKKNSSRSEMWISGRALCGRLYLLLLVCSCLKKQGATGSLRSQTEVKLFCSPAALSPNVLGSAKKGHRVSALCHCCSTQTDLLQSFHSLSNYMKLLVYYRLSE